MEVNRKQVFEVDDDTSDLNKSEGVRRKYQKRLP